MPPGWLQYSTRLRAASPPRVPRLTASIGSTPASRHQSMNSLVPKLVGLGRHPGEIEPARPLLRRADAVLPVVAGDEIAARIAHDGRRRARAPAPARPGGSRCASAVGMTGLEDAAIDAAAEMLDEGAEQPRVGRADREVAVQRDFDVTHCGHSSFETGIPDESVPPPIGASGLPASSGDSTAFFSRIE